MIRVLALLLAFICTASAAETTLLGGKLKFNLPDGWAPDKDRATKQAIGGYRSRKGDAWGTVARGTHGLQPDGLNAYVSRKVQEYSKGLSWVPNFTWLKKEIVTVDGRKWADLRYIGRRTGAKDPLDGLLYTRIFATSYEGQLLEFTFTSNTDPDPATKTKIDHLIDSVKLTD